MSCLVYTWGWLRDRNSLFCEFESSLVWVFELFLWVRSFFWGVPQILCSLLGDWLHNWLSSGEKKIVLCIVSFTYSLLLLLVALLVVLVLSFVVLLNYLYLNTQIFPFAHFSPSCWVSSCLVLVAGCWVKLRHMSMWEEDNYLTIRCFHLLFDAQVFAFAFFRDIFVNMYFAWGLFLSLDDIFLSVGTDIHNICAELK